MTDLLGFERAMAEMVGLEGFVLGTAGGRFLYATRRRPRRPRHKHGQPPQQADVARDSWGFSG